MPKNSEECWQDDTNIFLDLGLCFRVQSLGFKVKGLGLLRVEFRVLDLGLL